MFRPGKKIITKDLRTFWTTKNIMCTDNVIAAYVIHPNDGCHNHYLYDAKSVIWVIIFNVL